MKLWLSSHRNFIWAPVHDLDFTNSKFVYDKKHVCIWQDLIFLEWMFSTSSNNMPVFPKKICNSCLYRNPCPFMWSAGNPVLHRNVMHTTCQAYFSTFPRKKTFHKWDCTKVRLCFTGQQSRTLKIFLHHPEKHFEGWTSSSQWVFLPLWICSAR